MRCEALRRSSFLVRTLPSVVFPTAIIFATGEREKFHEVRRVMSRTYLPVLLLMGFVVFNAILMIGLSALTMRSRPTPVKQSAYESGIPVLGEARERFSVKFYMVAMLFIIFDIETVFLIPWGAYFRQLSCAVPLTNGVCPPAQVSFFGLGEMLVFMAILFVGFIYVWKKGALQWD
jgi:NADH-quinone oxidoreductase subunit A